MKTRLHWLLVPALALGVIGCKEKDTGQNTAQKDPQGISKQTVKVTDPGPLPKASLDAAQRAEMVGFAKHLPQDTEYLISVHNGSEVTQRIMRSKVWRAIAEMSGMPEGEITSDIGEDEIAADIGEEAADEMAEPGPAMFFGEEFTLAVGGGTSEQLSNLLVLNNRSNYYQMSAIVQMLAAMMEEDEDGEYVDPFDTFSEEFLVKLLNDEKSGIGLFEKTDMPPLYIAFKVSDENREVANQQITGAFQFMSIFGEMVEPVTAERGDSSFMGYRINGAKISEMMAEDRSGMEEIMTSATADRLIKAVSEKNLCFANGIYDDYIVIFIGSSMDDLVFADSVESSLAGGQALTFCDEYADKDLLAVFYGDGKGLQSVMEHANRGLNDLASGLRDGLASTDKLGDTRNLDALLLMVEERANALQAMATTHGGGTVAYLENGLHIESYGGWDSGFINWDAKNQLAPLGADQDVMLFANFTSDVEYDTRMREYLEALFETAYAGAMKVADLPIEDSDMVEFRQYLQLFDTKFRSDLLVFWEGFSNGFNGGLGQERALVVDLKGSMPAVPGVPQAIVDAARVPRLSWVAPIDDREKLASAWQKMNSSMTSMAGSISEILETDIPMQKPMSSDKDGNTSWFFPLPFLNEDFLPSVTLTDEWFAISSSQLQAIDLIGKAVVGGETTQGFILEADLELLRRYAKEMVKMMAENEQELPFSAEDLEPVETIIDACSELDSMNIHVRREEGMLRSSFHFKVLGE
ncbi:MAG: hypothetical protein R3242_06755 [Akkermansiaceae bacterium]|nr:hypothetical protein [Akkermansiaceae bacterium]